MMLLIDERFVAVVEDLFSFRSVQMENERTGSVDFFFFFFCSLQAFSMKPHSPAFCVMNTRFWK